MSRAARAFMIVATVIAAAISLTGYVIVMVTTDIRTAEAGFGVTLAGLGALLVCVHAWADLS